MLVKQIKKLSNSELWSQTKNAACDEKAATLLLLDYLAEVEYRKLFAEKAYSSLFEFVTRELGYSETQAYERINAMQLMQDIIEVKGQIQSGDLSLTTASQIQRFIKSEKKASGKKYNKAEKLVLISKCRNKPKREIEKILLEKSSEALIQATETERIISCELTELKFAVSEAVIKKLRKLHNLSDTSMALIFEEGLNQLIEKAEEKNEVKNKTEYKQSNQVQAQKITLPVKSKSKNSRYISKAIRQEVVKRSGYQCEYIDPLTKTRCESSYRLQFEHREPFALGGKSDLDNLEHFCPSHNQFTAIQVFGLAKVRAFHARL